ncbi:MAG: 16S rRNA (cytosine(1402)-N(4))-methyltransferase RsmH [Nitrospiraceae bacterium]
MEGNGKGSHGVESSHVPVLADAVLQWLPRRAGGLYVDCTLGYGGHTERLLTELPQDARVIALDQDQQALESARRRLVRFGDRVTYVHGNFSRLTEHLRTVGVEQVDGIVMDLGVSSPQLDRAERGFSFGQDGPLDMRMDQSRDLTAADLVNRLPEAELADVIYRYGEERLSRRIARAIVRVRAESPIRTTAQLVDVIRGAVPAAYRYGRIHCATRTFQALRIAVNRELDVLTEALPQAAAALAPGGRLAVISFHSLEDRIVKHTFRAWSHADGSAMRVLTKKPVEPTEEECATNPRARSAKMRVVERVA